MSSMLRRCRVCGFEAYTTKDLGLFRKEKNNKRGVTTICKNCYNKQQIEARKKNVHHHLIHRLAHMKQRGYNPNDPSYHNYGGRGITICDDWLNYPDVFVDWALNNGFKKELQIDRIDNDGTYSPDNCRWVTPSVQLMNKRTNVTDFEAGTRICKICKKTKPLEDYHKERRNCSGRRYVCKECRKTRMVG